MVKSTAKGFTLVELLIVVAIITVLATMVFIMLNPLELIRQSRDASRMADLGSLSRVINIAIQQSPNTLNVLCNGQYGSCSDRSDSLEANVRNVDGAGWIKVDLADMQGIDLAVLPVDPVNKDGFAYVYATDGNKYELNATLESKKFQIKMSSDGGNNITAYEVGTKYTLLP